ncbi:MAG: hypothetical protein QM479_09085 [Pseudomonadota bacterium]
MRLIVLMLLYLLSAEFIFSEVAEHKANIQVQKIEQRYHFLVKTQLNANANTLFDLLTDYNNINKLDKSILSSRIISEKGALIRVETISYDCIGPFCQQLKHTQDVQSFNNKVIVAKTIPQQSDYRFGYMQWYIQPIINNSQLEQSLITLTIELEPDFWLPPIVGDYFFKQKFSSSLQLFFINLEKMAIAKDNKK